MTSTNYSIGASFVWPAGHWLSEALGSVIPIKGRRMLDVGTGLGILPLAAGVKGAAQVVGTDYCTSALKMAELSALEMGLDKVSFSLLDWDIFTDDNVKDPWESIGGAEEFDLLCAADCIYCVSHAEKILNVLRSFFSYDRKAEAFVVCGQHREGASHFASLVNTLPLDITQYIADIPENKGTHHGSKLIIHRVANYAADFPLEKA